MTDYAPDDFPLDEELRAIWETQPTELNTSNPKELAMTVETAYQDEERTLRRLLFQEVVPAVGVAVVFALMGLSADSRSWAFFIAAAMSLGVGGFMLTNAKQQRRAEQVFGDDLRGGIERALSQATHRAWLYRNIAWWYLLPATISIALVLWASGSSSMTFNLVYAGGVVAFIGVLCWINRRVGRERYEPRVVELEALLADLRNPAG